MKTAVVTGTSYGIGNDILTMLLDNGWKVYGLSRTSPEIQHENFVQMRCDLSKPDEISECMQQISESSVEAFISNAGVISIEMASEVTVDSYNNTFAVNTLAPMLLIHGLKDKISHATIFTVSSLSDRIPEADMALYCSSKAANTSFFNSLALELADARVYSILPDYVDTPMLRGTMGEDKTFDWNATIQPKDIAKICKDILDNTYEIETGSNIIVVTEALKKDLKPIEKLYSYTTGTNVLSRM